VYAAAAPNSIPNTAAKTAGNHLDRDRVSGSTAGNANRTSLLATAPAMLTSVRLRARVW
jgi:hypothetical protein